MFSDGTRSYFPTRVPKTVKFNFRGACVSPATDAAGMAAPLDQYARLFADDVVDAVNHLTLPRYGLGNYQQPTPHKPPTPDEAKVLADLSRADTRLKAYAEEVKGTLFDLPEMRHAIEDIYKFPLLQSATDTLNRQLKSGISNQALAELVASLRADARLCRVTEDIGGGEPQVICSLGLRAV